MPAPYAGKSIPTRAAYGSPGAFESTAPRYPVSSDLTGLLVACGHTRARRHAALRWWLNLLGASAS